MEDSYYCSNCKRYVKDRFLITVSKLIQRDWRLNIIYCHRCFCTIKYYTEKEKVGMKSVI